MTNLIERFDICLAVKYTTWSNGDTVNSLQFGFDDQKLIAGIDYTMEKIGGKRFGYRVFWAKNQEVFTKMMASRKTLGRLQMEEVECWNVKEYESHKR